MGDGNVPPAGHASVLDAVVEMGLACRTVEEQMRLLEGPSRCLMQKTPRN